MRILITGNPPEGLDSKKIRMGIIGKLLTAGLPGDQVTEIVTINKHDDFTDALGEFCEGADIAYRIIPDALNESIDAQLHLVAKDF